MSPQSPVFRHHPATTQDTIVMHTATDEAFVEHYHAIPSPNRNEMSTLHDMDTDADSGTNVQMHRHQLESQPPHSSPTRETQNVTTLTPGAASSSLRPPRSPSSSAQNTLAAGLGLSPQVLSTMVQRNPTNSPLRSPQQRPSGSTVSSSSAVKKIGFHVRSPAGK